jgi:serine/threonine protein kinase
MEMEMEMENNNVISNSKKIPELIGEGSYGCVYKPTFKCQNSNIKIDEETELGKIMERKDAIREFEDSVEIANLDPNHQISIEKPKLCKPLLNQETKQALQSCSIANKFNDFQKNQLQMLVIKNGGIDLSVWLEQIADETPSMSKRKTNQKINKMWKAFNTLVQEGLAILLNKQTLHHDLKAQNIIYDTKKNVMKFIDYGFLITIPEVLQSSVVSKYKYAGYHWSYPFESGFYNKNIFDRFTSSYNYSKREFLFNKLKTKVLQNISNNKDEYNSNSENEDIDALTTVLNKFRGLGEERFYNYAVFYLDELAKFYLQLNGGNNEYMKFMKQSLQTFDLYGLGLTAMYLYSHLGETNEAKFEKIKEMMHPNPFLRKIHWDL